MEMTDEDALSDDMRLSLFCIDEQYNHDNAKAGKYNYSEDKELFVVEGMAIALSSNLRDMIKGGCPRIRRDRPAS